MEIQTRCEKEMRRKGKFGYARLIHAIKSGEDERLPRRQMDLSDLENIRRTHFFIPCRISFERLCEQELSQDEKATDRSPSVPFPFEEIETADTIQTFMRLYPPSPLQRTILDLFLQGDSLKVIAKELGLPFKTVFNEFNMLVASWRQVARQFNIAPPITLRESKFLLEEKEAMKMGFVLLGRPVLAKAPKANCVLQYDGEKWVAVESKEIFKPYAKPIKLLPVVGSEGEKEIRTKINEIIKILGEVGIVKEERNVDKGTN